MISFRSFSNFVLVNACVGGIGLISSWVLGQWDETITAFVFVEIVQTIVLIKALDSVTVTKPAISEITDDLPVMNVVATATLKGVMHALSHPSVCKKTVFATFLLRSFTFELVFDFFHYWMHRGLHAYPKLYQSIHKRHHRYQHTSVYTAYYTHPVEIVLTYAFPFMIGLAVVPFSCVEFSVLTAYLGFQEIAGHLGRRMAPASSFIQFMWLPKWLGIELYTEDHNLHHSRPTVNFSKRFSLWDRLFGTYCSSLQIC